MERLLIEILAIQIYEHSSRDARCWTAETDERKARFRRYARDVAAGDLVAAYSGWQRDDESAVRELKARYFPA